MGDENDSVAVAKGLVKTIKSNVAVVDTIFSPRKLSVEDVKNLRYVPHSNNVEFILNASMFETESKIVVPVVECKAPFKVFMDSVEYKQQLINYITEEKDVFNRYPGIMFGSMEGANNEAGNWVGGDK